MTRTPDVLIFDMFGVIADNQSQASRSRLVVTASVPEADFWAAYWALRPPYDRGDVTGLHYWTSVAERLNTTFNIVQKHDLIAHDVASWAMVDDRMIELLEELSATTRLAILSNIPYEIANHYIARHRWLDLFEVRAFSHHMGFAKPDPDAYKWCLNELGIEPRQALFVDDRAENIRAAAKIGLQGHLFRSPEALIHCLSSGPNQILPLSKLAHRPQINGRLV
ncbi:HAD family hydrolase [Pseudarthrobacter raffinosi]|uniref:HAD family hydrolase n=1 Tax=Pseudarthrobacter raffinosi TaxID=2953651 RepID=UPI00208E28FA|nr:HAD-IA family hydrolase [Pseudarthrobacter sp. MDT3-9]MCO4253239.1 HAD-IA family hydrolase [Pseudarthrobacter sp. MDT3-9]